MRPFGASPVLAVQSHFEGDAGAALYLSPPDAASAAAIIYDRFRPLGERWVVVDPDYVPGEYLLSDAGVDLVKTPATALEFELPAEYAGASFWCQVRPHEDGLELDTIYRPRRITLDDDGVEVETIAGRAVIVGVTKLDDGGLRVAWDYYPSRLGVDPTEFAIVCVDGPTTPDEVMVDRVANSSDRYSADVADLNHGATYEFELRGRVDAVDTVLGSIEFVPDASGPTLSLSATAAEES